VVDGALFLPAFLFAHLETKRELGRDLAPAARVSDGVRGTAASLRSTYTVDQVRPCLHGAACEQGQDDHRLGARILDEERGIAIASRPLEASVFQIETVRIAYVFYESGLSINVMYTVDNPQRRAVGFKLSEGMEVPAELASKFKFARRKSKLAGTIHGSYFAFKNEY